jgi:hypothetical protein
MQIYLEGEQENTLGIQMEKRAIIKGEEFLK